MTNIIVNRSEIERLLYQDTHDIKDDLRALLDKAQVVDKSVVTRLMYQMGIKAYTVKELEAKIAELLLKIDRFQELLDDKDTKIAKLEKALNPRLWDEKLNAAWHKNIPDVQKAFDAIREHKHE